MITLSAFQGIFIKDRIFGIKHIMIAKLAIRRISPYPEKILKFTPFCSIMIAGMENK